MGLLSRAKKKARPKSVWRLYPIVDYRSCWRWRFFSHWSSSLMMVSCICFRTYGLGKDKENGKRYFYLDYEPRPGIRWAIPDKPTTHEEIREWVSLEYGLVITSRDITQFKRNHGVATRNLSCPMRENIKVPPEKEAAIEAAFRHFGMMPDEN